MSNIAHKKSITVGFIGQGFVGKNLADNFERRGYLTVRYALEDSYSHNRNEISKCDIVFLAVPTPSNPQGFDESIIHEVLPLVGGGKTVVIKSTIPPGTTDRLQEQYKDISILFSPEFLSEASAVEDTESPSMNIIGVPCSSGSSSEVAKRVLSILPHSPYTLICEAKEAELIKYVHNIHGFIRVVYTNMIYDLASVHNCNWSVIADAMNSDPYMNSRASSYNQPLHKTGRGAGGHCFIKDFAAFKKFYISALKDPFGIELLEAFEKKNIDLLVKSGKDLDLLEGVYGPSVLKRDN